MADGFSFSSPTPGADTGGSARAMARTRPDHLGEHGAATGTLPSPPFAQVLAQPAQCNQDPHYNRSCVVEEPK